MNMTGNTITSGDSALSKIGVGLAIGALLVSPGCSKPANMSYLHVECAAGEVPGLGSSSEGRTIEGNDGVQRRIQTIGCLDRGAENTGVYNEPVTIELVPGGQCEDGAEFIVVHQGELWVGNQPKLGGSIGIGSPDDFTVNEVKGCE